MTLDLDSDFLLRYSDSDLALAGLDTCPHSVINYDRFILWTVVMFK